MYVVTVDFRVKPNDRDLFHSAVLKQARNSLQKEDNCKQFEVLVNRADRNVVLLYEVYTDRAAFDAHCTTDHFREFSNLVADWIDEKRVACWQPMETE